MSSWAHRLRSDPSVRHGMLQPPFSVLRFLQQTLQRWNDSYLASNGYVLSADAVMHTVLIGRFGFL